MAKAATKARSTSVLSKGQVPFEDLLTIRTAHDVRRLRACARCGEIGDSDLMAFGYPYDNDYFHGRCFVAEHGFEALLQLPGVARKLTLGDLGLDLMRQLIEADGQSIARR